MNCPKCKQIADEHANYCSSCGQQLSLSVSFSTTKIVLLALFSIFFAPLGLVPAIKYLRQSDVKAKKMGWLLIGLTIISVIFMLVVSWQFTKSLADLYQNLGAGYY